MAFSRTVHNLTRCATYENAVALFKTPPLRGSAWSHDERPLGSSGQHHYRVQKMLDGSFRVYLYSTCMAQFWAPEGEERVINYSWDRRGTSTSFMSYVVRVSETLCFCTTDGHRVCVPLQNGGVVLHMVDGKLDISRSSHPPEMVRCSSPKDKLRRALARKELASLVTLAAIRYGDMAVPPSGKQTYGPFTSPCVSQRAVQQMRAYPLMSTEFIEAFIAAAEHVVRYSKGKAAFMDKGEPGLATLEKSLMTWCLKALGMNTQSGIVQMPRFPEIK